MISKMKLAGKAAAIKKGHSFVFDNNKADTNTPLGSQYGVNAPLSNDINFPRYANEKYDIENNNNLSGKGSLLKFKYNL